MTGGKWDGNQRIEVDTHVHTITSVHAYNTVSECICGAEKNGMKAIAVTDHFGPFFLNGSLFQHYASICNLRHMDENIYDIKMITGVEIDIIDKKGNLAFYDQYFPFDREKSVCDKLLDKVKVVIASYHEFERKYSFEENTEMLFNVLNNQRINIIGHCDRMTNSFDMDFIIPLAVKKNKIIELNCSSLEGNEEMAAKLKRLAVKCAENGVMVSVGSDAHFAYKIGDFGRMLQMLDSIRFPQNLVVNKTEDKFINTLLKQKETGH